MSKTAREVKLFVEEFFRERRITQIMIADKIGVLRQTVAVFLSDKTHYFSKRNAISLHYAYGFALDFLMKGDGEPLAPCVSNDDVADHIREKMRFLQQVEQNSSLLADIGGNEINSDVLKGMKSAYFEVLQFILTASNENV